jgi:hypothetical protein
MNRRPGHVKVTTETGFCGFCGRPRNLRREEHQLGTLVRTIVTCETCHRTLSSEIGVAQPEPVAVAAPVAEKPETQAEAGPPPKPKRATKATTSRTRKPKSTATKKTTTTK